MVTTQPSEGRPPLTSKRILVTGVTGMVAGPMAAQLVAAGNTVYAFLSDDRGLADTPWPSLRRDARNTGNANAPKYGIRTIAGTCTQ